VAAVAEVCDGLQNSTYGGWLKSLSSYFTKSLINFQMPSKSHLQPKSVSNMLKFSSLDKHTSVVIALVQTFELCELRSYLELSWTVLVKNIKFKEMNNLHARLLNKCDVISNKWQINMFNWESSPQNCVHVASTLIFNFSSLLQPVTLISTGYSSQTSYSTEHHAT